MAGEAYFDFNLDFGNVSIPRRLRVTQYGDQLPTFRAKLYNMGTPYSIPDGATVSVRWKKPSNTIIYNPVSGFSENTITYSVDKQCIAVSGICSVCFEISIGGKAIETPVFPVEVVQNPVQDNDIEDVPQYDALEKIVEDAAKQAQDGFNEAVEQVKTEASAIAKDATSAATAAAERAESAADRCEAVADEFEGIFQDGAVASVNGKTGRVQLNAVDIPFENSSTQFTSANVQDAIKETLTIVTGTNYVKTVNSQAPDGTGNVTVDTGIMTVNNQQPDESGNISLNLVEPVVTYDSVPSSIQMNPNTLYFLGTTQDVQSLTLTFNPGESGKIAEYHIIFRSGATATTLSLPSSVKKPDDFEIEKNKIYELSVVENLLLACSWSV